MARERRRRLLVVTSTFPARVGDGTPEFILELARYESRHFDTMVLAPRVPGAVRTEDLDGVHVERFPYFLRRWELLAHGAIIDNVRSKPWLAAEVAPLMLAESWAVRRAVARFRPDALHLHWIVPQGIVGAIAARGVPAVVSTLGGDVYALTNAAWRRAKTFALRNAYAVTTMNADMRGRLIDLGADPARTHVLPMGVDLALIDRAAGVRREPGRIVFAGRLVEKKGVPVLFDALRQLDTGSHWSLDVIGDGPLRSALEAAAAGLSVRFLGQLGRDDFARALSAAEIVVVPSVQAASGDQEGLPVTLLEAMAAGAAVVASDLPGINDAVVDGESGILFPPGDPAALARALRILLGDAERRRGLASAARQRAQRYSIEAIGEQFVALLTASADHV
jgi:glycosyltransferase involved in cell wall biosynthesis